MQNRKKKKPTTKKQQKQVRFEDLLEDDRFDDEDYDSVTEDTLEFLSLDDDMIASYQKEQAAKRKKKASVSKSRPARRVREDYDDGDYGNEEDDEDEDEIVYEVEDDEDEEIIYEDEDEEVAYADEEDEDDEEAYYADEEDEDDEEAYYADDEEDDEEDYYEDEDDEDDEDYYEDEDYEDEDDYEYYEDDDEDGFAARLSHFISEMNGLDMAVAVLGILVLVGAIVTGGIYVHAKSTAKQVAAFASVGEEIEGVSVIGESGLLAVSESARLGNMIDVESEDPEEQEVNEEEDENGEVTVELRLTSILSDMKIKFVNKKTGKLIGGVPFEVEVSGPKSYTLKDDDKDGVIYQKDIAAGSYEVKILPLSGEDADKYKLPSGSSSVKVTDKIAYEKVDVADEVKSESEINVAQEEATVQNTVVESSLKDTVEWVESTKTPVGGADEEFEKVSLDHIVDPWKTTSAFRKMVNTGIDTHTEDNNTGTPGDDGSNTGGDDNKGDGGGTGNEGGNTGNEGGGTGNEGGGTGNEGGGTGNEGGGTGNEGGNTGNEGGGTGNEGGGTGNEGGNTGNEGGNTGNEGGNTSSGSTSSGSTSSGSTSSGSTSSGSTSSGSTGSGDTQPPAPTPDLGANAKISISKSSMSLETGKSDLLSVSVDNGASYSVDWSSDNEKVAKVSGGKVTAVGAGSATVTATVKLKLITNKERIEKLKCAVTVTDVAVTYKKLTINGPTKVGAGKKVTLTATTDPKDGKVTWSTENEKIAKVDASGVVTGVAAGKVKIYAACKGANEVKEAYQIEVVNDVDGTAKLKDKDGNQLYYKKDGKYIEATHKDYLEHKTFFKKKKASAYTYTGWQTIDGHLYYFDKNGNYVTGDQVIQGAKYTFGSDGKMAKSSGTMGIDVSKHNGNIDWNAVKNSGVSYVIIRCGYRGYSTGVLVEDPKFRSNIQGAKAAGLKVGAYFFSQAVNEVEAVEEASMAIDLVKGYGLNYPLFLDVEGSGGRADGISRDTRTAVCKTFCQTVQNSGISAGVYANKTWFTEKINTASLTSYKLWLAQYASAPTYTATRYDLWQYSSKGKVSGISGNVDMNISYVSY